MQTNDFKEVVNNLIPDRLGEIQKRLSNLFIFSMMCLSKKVKMLKKIRFGFGKFVMLRKVKDSSKNATGNDKGTNVDELAEP